MKEVSGEWKKLLLEGAKENEGAYPHKKVYRVTSSDQGEYLLTYEDKLEKPTLLYITPMKNITVTLSPQEEKGKCYSVLLVKNRKKVMLRDFVIYPEKRVMKYRFLQ